VPAVKKIIVVLALVALGLFAARKIRST
jgi:hypothetical protein